MTETKRVYGIVFGYYVLQLAVLVVAACVFAKLSVLVYGAPEGGSYPLLGIFLFAMALWVLYFFADQSKFISMFGAASYYFSSSPQSGNGSANLGLGVKYACSTHVGSIATGSGICMLITMMRILAEMAEQQAREEGGNGAVQCFFCCLACLLRCVEDAVDYLTKNAYAYMAVSGEPFCTSAKNGFLINLKYVIEFISAANFTGIVINIGALMIGIASAALFYVLAAFII